MKLYFRYLSMHLKSQMQYKASFFLTLCGQFLSSFSAFLGVYFMMERFRAVEGFTLGEILLCFGTVMMAFALAECFARGFDTFDQLIANGEFDRMLLRPHSPLFQVMAAKMDFTRAGRLLQAVLILAAALPLSGVTWNAVKLVCLLLMILCGCAVFAGLFVLYAGICFFTTSGLEFMNLFTDGGREFGRYPVSIYGKTALRFFTFVVPMALFQYYPLLFLLDRGSWVYALFPLLSLLFLLPCCIVWRLGLRRYRSTGS